MQVARAIAASSAFAEDDSCSEISEHDSSSSFEEMELPARAIAAFDSANDESPLPDRVP
jgi:hypothetical protein